MKLAARLWDAVGVFSEVASLASNYEFPNPFSLRDTTISQFFQNCSTNIDKKLLKFDSIKVLAGVANRAFNSDFSKAFGSRDMTFFNNFSKFFNKKILI